MSPDDGSAQSPTYPQSWNLYSYVLNNPLSSVDPTGHSCVYSDNNQTAGDDGDGKGCAAAGITPSDNPGNDPGQFDPSKTQNATVNSGNNATSFDYIPLPSLASVATTASSQMPQLVGPELPQIGPAMDNPKEAYCLKQAAIGAGKDVTGIGLVQDIADAASASDPSKVSAGDATDLVKRGADAIGESAVAQAAIRQGLRAQGMKVPMKGVGRVASKAGKVAGAIGLGLTTISAYEAYQECMAQ